MASEQEQMRQRSRVRQVAEERESGFSTTTLKLPEGIKFFKPELGLNTIDIIGYKAGKGNPNGYEGDLWYERTYWRYNEIGPEKKSYVAAGKTFGRRDPIQDWLKRAAIDGNQDKKYLDSLKPKQRQLFLVVDNKHPENGIMIWDFSYHNFGKTLLDVIQASPESYGWDYFYFLDKRGFTLALTVTNKSMGVGNPFKEVSNINFIPRQQPLPEHIANHKYCLDDFLVETDYDVLWRAFHNLPSDGSQDASVPGGPVGAAVGSSGGGTTQLAQHAATTAAEPPRHTEAQRQQVAEESLEDQKKRVVEMAAAAYANGQKRDANPFDKGTPRYTWWLEGWMDAMDSSPTPQKNDPPPVVQKPQTAAERGIGKMDDVLYNGAKHTVFRISEDGLTLTLIAENNDVVPGVSVASVQKADAPTVPKTQLATQQQQTQQPAPTPAPTAAPPTEDDWDKDWSNG